MEIKALERRLDPLHLTPRAPLHYCTAQSRSLQVIRSSLDATRAKGNCVGRTHNARVEAIRAEAEVKAAAEAEAEAEAYPSRMRPKSKEKKRKEKKRRRISVEEFIECEKKQFASLRFGS